MRLNKFQVANIKRVAQSLDSFNSKLNPLINKSEEIESQIKMLMEQKEAYNAPIRQLFGYNADDLVEKVTNENGIKTYKFRPEFVKLIDGKEVIELPEITDNEVITEDTSDNNNINPFEL